MGTVVFPIGFAHFLWLSCIESALCPMRVLRILLWLCIWNPMLAFQIVNHCTCCLRKRKDALHDSRMLLGWVRRIWVQKVLWRAKFCMLQASCPASRRSRCLFCGTKIRMSRRLYVWCRSGLSLTRWFRSRRFWRCLAILGSLRRHCRVYSSTHRLCNANLQRFAMEQTASFGYTLCESKVGMVKYFSNNKEENYGFL